MALTSWRYRCPRGHTNLQPGRSGVYCRQCKEQGWPAWHTRVLDGKTGETVAVESFHS